MVLLPLSSVSLFYFSLLMAFPSLICLYIISLYIEHLQAIGKLIYGCSLLERPRLGMAPCLFGSFLNSYLGCKSLAMGIGI